MIGNYFRQKERGAVSLFIVVFTALLMSIVTISFVQLMVKDQEQATASDLSQSAYDSAQAGVEDAKRLLLLEQACKNGTASAGVNCAAIDNALSPAPGQRQTDCDTLASSGIVTETNNETIIQQDAGDSNLDQAYTCVKVAKNTQDYLGQLEVNESIIVPLSSSAEFNNVELSWFSEKDISSVTNNPTIGFPSTGANVQLPRVGTRWQFNYPALMRAQVIQLGGTFTLDQFNDATGSGSNANTLFLYPSSVGATTKSFATDGRRNPGNAPQPIRCRATLAGGGYACTVSLQLSAPADGNTANRNAYLRLSALYNQAHFSLKLTNNTGGEVSFANVQPEVDSTGRANNLFRRVVSRIELRGEFAYPDVELDVAGDLCKNFSVTTETADYQNSGTCTP
jgi:Tfp pilus assembly protein PilX